MLTRTASNLFKTLLVLVLVAVLLPLGAAQGSVITGASDTATATATGKGGMPDKLLTSGAAQGSVITSGSATAKGGVPDKLLTSQNFTVTLDMPNFNISTTWTLEFYVYSPGVDICTHYTITDTTCVQVGTNHHGQCTFTRDISNASYGYWIKHSKYLAAAGTFTVPTSSGIDLGDLDPGDCDNDNVVDIADYNILRNTYGKALGDPGYDARADFNGDNVVNITDFYAFQNYFGYAGPSFPSECQP